MKVYGVTVFPPREWGFDRRQVRAYIKARSWKAAHEALEAAGVRMSLNHMQTYGSIVGSESSGAVHLGFDLAGTVAAQEHAGPVRTVHEPGG